MQVGTKVLARDNKMNKFGLEGEVTAIRRTGRSYTITLENGFETIRNSRDLIPILTADSSPHPPL